MVPLTKSHCQTSMVQPALQKLPVLELPAAQLSLQLSWVGRGLRITCCDWKQIKPRHIPINCCVSSWSFHWRDCRTHTHKHRHRHRHTHTDTDTDIDKHTDTDTDTDKHRHRHTDTDTHTQAQTQTQTHTRISTLSATLRSFQFFFKGIPKQHCQSLPHGFVLKYGTPKSIGLSSFSH